MIHTSWNRFCIIRVGEQLLDGLTRDVRSLRWSVMGKWPPTLPKIEKNKVVLKCILGHFQRYEQFLFLGMPSKNKKSKLWDIGPKGGEGSKPNPKCWSVLNLGHLRKGGGGLKIHVPILYLIFLLYWMLYMSHVNSVYRGLPVSLTTI